MRIVQEIEKDQNCNQCDEKFDSKKELKLHIASVHDGKKLYQCSFCLAYFSGTAAVHKMKLHMMSVHEFEKLLECKPRELLKMNLVHIIGKRHSCNKCNEKFDTKRDLKVHCLSVHEGKKFYKCSFCEACFIGLYKIKTHLESVHSKKNILKLKHDELLRSHLVLEIGNH